MFDRQRLRSMVKKEFLQMFRDAQTLRLLVVAPILQLIVLGYAVTNDPKNLRLGYLDMDHTQSSRRLIQDLSNVGYFRLHPVASQADLVHELDSGRSQVTLQIPPGFDRTLTRGDIALIQMMVDGSDSNTATMAMAYVSGTTGHFAGRVQAEYRSRRGGPNARLLTVAPQVWYNPALLSRHYILPGLVSIIVAVLASSLTALSIAREREAGTLEQLMVTPLSTGEFMVGKMIPPAAIAFVDAIVVSALSVLWFGIPFRGSAVFFLVATVPFVIATLGFGLLLSSVARNQQQAMLLTIFNNLPQVLLSGFLFPISTMPIWAQGISLLIPQRYFLVIVRGIYLKGLGPTALWPQIAALVALSTAIFVLGVRLFRRRLD